MHSKKTFRCHCLPLSLPLAPPTRQVYVAAIKRVEGRAGLVGPREPDGTPAHSLSCHLRVLAVSWGVWVAHAVSCATEQEGLYFPFHIKPRRTAPSANGRNAVDRKARWEIHYVQYLGNARWNLNCRNL